MNDAVKEPCGVLVIDKPAGWTSFDVIGKLRRLYGKMLSHNDNLLRRSQVYQRKPL